MADLKWEVAESLAGSLTTIGHPMAKTAIMATALDLTRWCKGAILDGRPWTAEEQAEWLVARVRYGPNAWHNWQDCGGTAALHEIFLAKFPPPMKPETKILTPEQIYAKGLVARPCAACDDRLYVGAAPNMQYCLACPQGRHNAKWQGDEALHRLNCQRAKRVPVDGFNRPGFLTPTGMARAAADEMRRKREQLERTGMA